MAVGGSLVGNRVPGRATGWAGRALATRRDSLPGSAAHCLRLRRGRRRLGGVSAVGIVSAGVSPSADDESSYARAVTSAGVRRVNSHVHVTVKSAHGGRVRRASISPVRAGARFPLARRSSTLRPTPARGLSASVRSRGSDSGLAGQRQVQRGRRSDRFPSSTVTASTSPSRIARDGPVVTPERAGAGGARSPRAAHTRIAMRGSRPRTSRRGSGRRASRRRASLPVCAARRYQSE